MSEPDTKFVSLNELARRERVNHMTARRRCRSAGLVADAVLVGGTVAGPVPLFLEERAPLIGKIITAKSV